MISTKKIIPLLTIGLLLTACEELTGPQGTLGAILGGTAGGVIASEIDGSPQAIAAGVILGGLIGGAIGDSLDQMDRRYMAETAQKSLESSPNGKALVWQNPDNGHSGSLTPVKTFKTKNDVYCREFQQTVTIDGQSELASGTACRQGDGTWKIVK